MSGGDLLTVLIHVSVNKHKTDLTIVLDIFVQPALNISHQHWYTKKLLHHLLLFDD